MKILIVGVVKNNQLERLREEAIKKGHKLDACLVTDITILADEGKFIPKLRGKELSDYNLIYLLTLGTRRWVWYAACEYLKNKGVVIVNGAVVDPEFNFNINVAKEYFLEAKYSIPFPKSVVFLSSKSVPDVKKYLRFPMILKSGEGRQGKSVFKIQDEDELIRKTQEFEKEKLTCVAREFIPNDGDIRVFTVGYKAIAAMRRIPKRGDFKSNISQGGKGEKFELDEFPEIRKLAEKASEINRVEIAGVDVIINKETGKPYILEVNPGPQFTGLEKYTGVNAALEIIKYFENLRNNTPK